LPEKSAPVSPRLADGWK